MSVDLQHMTEDAAAIASGTLVTLVLVAASVVLGFAIASLLVLMRRSRQPLLRWCAASYALIFRGMPLLVTIFLIYYGPGQFAWVRASVFWPFLRDAYFCALLALSLVTAAYASEFLHEALRQVPAGAVEAARALGLGRMAAFWLVTVPIAARIIIPLYASEIILLLKGSSLVSSISIVDLTGAANTIFYRTYDPYFPFLLAGTIYLVLGLGIARLGLWLEKRVEPGYQTAGGTGSPARRASASIR